MNLQLHDKVAVVLGASKGLGKGAALALAREGCRVAICARKAESLNKTAREIAAFSGNEPLTAVADVGKSQDLEQFFNRVLEKWSGIDILVTNAGGPPVKAFADTRDDEWHTWFDITFMSVLRAVRLALPSMQKNRWGRIINITSVSVKAPVESLIYSNALRLAVVGLAKSLANELGPFGITVNNLAPGYHLTDGLERIVRAKIDSGLSREEVLSAWEQKVPLRRLGKPDDLAELICFLASDLAGYISGVTIPVDGGLYPGI